MNQPAVTAEVAVYLSEQQTAALLGVSRRTIRRLVRQGVLPKPVRLGTGPRARKRWTRAAIDAALRKQGASR
jgi:excisionase family DNA binding protein